jgi:multiple sugar transport system permease protein
MSVTAPPEAIAGTRRAARTRERPARRGRTWLAQLILGLTAIAFLFPLVYAIYTSLRPYEETARLGYASIGGKFSFENYSNAWSQADLPHYYVNTLLITVPAILLVLGLASMVAFAVSRYSWRFNIALLMIFTAANLLPQQVIITPLYRIFLEIPLPTWLSDSETLYDSYLGIILIHVAFQMGFCVFVLSNYMRTLPGELTEAAMVDGASIWVQYRKVIMPLCRAPLAALATLEFTWIYNDFFWALVLMQSGEKRPITSALAGLQGQFFTNNNLIAAASLVAAVPTLVVYLILQRQFIGGLTLGATKG